MGIHIIKMPDIGEGIAEVELVAWNVKEGDTVVEDQNLADVMTDKATVEIPSPVHGKVLALGGKVGQVMAVGSELIRIEVEGAGNVREGAGAPAPAAAAVVATPVPAPVSAPVAAKSAPTPAPAPAPVPAPAPAAARAATAPARGAASITRPVGDKPVASPAVRAHAWDLGIDLQYVQGSGPAGRITREDIDAYAQRGKVGGSAPSARDTRYARRDDEERIEVIGLRRKIAQKMQDAKRRIPHFAYVEEVDVTELEALRAKLNQKFGAQRGKLTMLPFIMRAVILAVREYPQMNARFDDEAGVVVRSGAVHLGMATQTEAGLMVPVLAHAETLDLWQCAAEVSRLASASRSGKATRDELTGSTITITSLGALGGIVTTPVINAPEVAIVGVNRVVERPMIRDGLVVARKMMNLSSSFDHRVVDGIHAAEFVQVIRGYLENPATLFVE
ncbi:MAG: dihydrolipoamide acetyltransferase family protein [Burkholderiaceae bacterium]